MSEQNSLSMLAQMAGTGDREDFSTPEGFSLPTLYWRSGNVMAADLAPGTARHTGSFIIDEEAVPADENGEQIEMVGFEPMTYTNQNGKKKSVYSATELTFSVVAMRRCHMDGDTGSRMEWKKGWDEDAYELGYKQKTVQLLVTIKGIESPTPFVISLSNRQQVRMTGKKGSPGVLQEFIAGPVYDCVVASGIIKAGEKMTDKTTPPERCFWMTVAPLLDEGGDPVFESSKFVNEHGKEEDGKATTTFALVLPDDPQDSLLPPATIHRHNELRSEYEEWRLEWNEDKVYDKKEPAKEPDEAQEDVAGL